MKQFPIIARALDVLDEQTAELNQAMKAGADVNYVSLNGFAQELERLKESFKVVVLARKQDAITL